MNVFFQFSFWDGKRNNKNDVKKIHFLTNLPWIISMEKDSLNIIM